MATEAQINANRANAQKSTGPRTPEGKAVVSQNAVTHGFLARETVISGEDPGEFEFYRDRMLGDLAPAGDAETEMAQRAVGLAWRLRRAERLQTEAFDTLYEKMATGSPAGGDDRLLGRMLVEDFTHARVLDHLLMYERRIESSLFRTLRELREHKRVRQSQPVAQSRGTGLASASLAELALPARGMGLEPMNHRRDADATRTPGGGVTRPSAQPSCETKPISACAGGVPGDRGTGDGSSRKESDETKPILRGDLSPLSAVRRVA